MIIELLLTTAAASFSSAPAGAGVGAATGASVGGAVDGTGLGCAVVPASVGGKLVVGAGLPVGAGDKVGCGLGEAVDGCGDGTKVGCGLGEAVDGCGEGTAVVGDADGLQVTSGAAPSQHTVQVGSASMPLSSTQTGS